MYFFLGFKVYPCVKKVLLGHRVILSYIGLNFPQFHPQKGNFELLNHELRNPDYQSKSEPLSYYQPYTKRENICQKLLGVEIESKLIQQTFR